MATSEARIIANRKNCLKSSGPSPAGREISRRNGLKHGLTGAGVVLVADDTAEVERRIEAFRADLAPRTEYGLAMVAQMATLSVRMDRGFRQELASQATRTRHATRAFDEARVDEAEALFEAIGDDPRACVRKLRRSPEGVGRLIEAWGELRDDLSAGPKPTWTAWHQERASNLSGRKLDDHRASRISALSKATWGDFADLADREGGDLPVDDRKAWARARLVERIDEEMAGLEAHHETFDFESIDLDRAEAGQRSLFDPSKEATLARRYEAEARRGFFRALGELRRVEAEAAERPESRPEPAPEPAAPLASSWEKPSPTPREPRPIVREATPMAPTSPEPTFSTARGADGRPLTIGLAGSGRN